MMKYSGFIVLDIETTGFDPKTDDAIEVSAVRLDQQGKEVASLDLLLKNNKPLSPVVIALTGITPQMLEGQPTLAEVAGQIEEFVGDLPIVGHNINFDVDFLVAKGLNIPGDRLDTLDLAQTILPAQPGYGLEQLAHRLQFDRQPSHRAMKDVLATIDLFHHLIHSVQSLQPETITAVRNLLTGQDWSWGWVFEDIPTLKLDPKSFDAVSEYTDYLKQQIDTAKLYQDKIGEAVTAKMNLIESHLPGDTLAYNLLYAANHAPALVVIPGSLVRQINWKNLASALEAPISLGSTIALHPATISPLSALAGAEEITPALLRLVIKMTIWETEWQRDPFKLYLNSDEQYEWEQKMVDDHSSGTFRVTPNGVTLVTTDVLTKIDNISDFEIVSSHPHTLEEGFFDAQTRTFSVAYLNAAISSRRDFIHREIVPQDAKAADELFKIISQLGPRFNKLTEILTKIYFEHPPISVYEKDIELTREVANPDFDTTLDDIVTLLTQYNEKLITVGITEDNQQYQRTDKLINYLRALRSFNFEYKYFLFAEENKFYLQIIPGLNIFGQIRELFLNSKRTVVISAGLVYGGSFGYWQYLFPEGAGKLVSFNRSANLQLITDVSEEDNYQDILRVIETALTAQHNLLLLHGSAYDSRILFEDIHAALPQYAGRITSMDTSGLSDKLPNTLASSEGRVIIVPLYWVERAALSLGTFNAVAITKLAFEANSKPIAKLYRGDRTSFGAYTLPKTTLRLKENLHYLSSFEGPVVLLDPRLVNKDYGQDILRSTTGWQIDSINLAEALSQL